MEEIVAQIVKELGIKLLEDGVSELSVVHLLRFVYNPWYRILLLIGLLHPAKDVSQPYRKILFYATVNVLCRRVSG